MSDTLPEKKNTIKRKSWKNTTGGAKSEESRGLVENRVSYVFCVSIYFLRSQSKMIRWPDSTPPSQINESPVVSGLQRWSLGLGCKPLLFASCQPLSEYERTHSSCVTVVWFTSFMSVSVLTVLNRWRKHIRGNAAVYFPPVQDLLWD